LPFADFPAIDVPVLDDTGSAFLEVYNQDCFMLGVLPGVIQQNRWVWLDTVGGLVGRHLLFLEAQLLDRQQNPIRGRVPVTAVVDPGDPDRLRCSGMFVRKSLFTATAPDMSGLLHVAERKNGIVTHLPVV